ncbi:MAG: transcriptional regulator [Tardiphaga sp.]|jgi:DNA-binding NarL/FixJ family response regulator|nr:transcriptional regulator [Tardiphaga sp.]
MGKRVFFEVIILGKSTLFKEGLGRILNSADFRVIGSVESAAEVSSLKPRAGAGALLLLHSNDGADYTRDQLEKARQLLPGARIAVVTDRYRLHELISATRAGAHGYFVDIMTCDLFVKSLELIMMGQTIFPAAFMSYVLGADGKQLDDLFESEIAGSTHVTMSQDRVDPDLSPREISILRHLIEGDSNKCIARKIDIAEATVKVHVKAILRKIRVQNRTQAAIWGLNNGPLSRPAEDDPSRPPEAFSGRQNTGISVKVSERGSIMPPALVRTIDHRAGEVQMLGLDHLLNNGNIRKVSRG